MNHSTGGRIARTSIREILIIETGTYNQMYARPYSTDLEPSTLSNITDNVVSTYNATGSVTASSLIDVASSFIRPTAAPERLVQITNGWNEKRLRFMMNVEYEWATGGKTREYITGYTDYCGWNPHSGNMDNDMNFFVSAVLTTRESMMRDPVGGTYIAEVPVAANQMLSNPHFVDVFHPERLIGLRPQDLFLNMDDTQWADMSPGLTNLTDTRLEVKETGLLSSRSNQIPSKYMANVINSYVQANGMAGTAEHDDVVKRQAHTLAREKMIAHNPFLTAIANNSHRSYGNSTRFTLKDLRAVDPTVDARIVLSVSSPHQLQTSHHTGQTENWHGRDALTVAAASIAQAVPGLMSELLLTKVSFISSNNHPDGALRTVLPNARSFAKNVDMTQNFATFIARLEREIISGITYNNQLSINLTVTADLVGETYITISLDGSPDTPFCMPSFADNLLPVVVTNNQAVVAGVAHDFDTLLSNIGANLGNVDTAIYTGQPASFTQNHHSAVVL